MAGLLGRTGSKLVVCHVTLWTSLDVTYQRSELVSRHQHFRAPISPIA